MEERDGSTPANAILEDQNAWIRRNCPGYTLVLQALTTEGRDVLILRSPDGKDIRRVYFDVSSHFGKSLKDLVTSDGEQDKKDGA